MKKMMGMLGTGMAVMSAMYGVYKLNTRKVKMKSPYTSNK